MTIIAAFDPGITGAVALCNEYTKHAPIGVFDLPTMGTGKQVVLNGTGLAAILRDARAEYAVIEHVHSMPRQGVTGVFKFGCVFGQILGVVQALGIPYELVQPATWKRGMRLPGGEGKGEAARGRALELFPSLCDQLARKKDHNRAEALLLARWWLDKNQAPAKSALGRGSNPLAPPPSPTQGER